MEQKYLVIQSNGKQSKRANNTFTRFSITVQREKLNSKAGWFSEHKIIGNNLYQMLLQKLTVELILLFR